MVYLGAEDEADDAAVAVGVGDLSRCGGGDLRDPFAGVGDAEEAVLVGGWVGRDEFVDEVEDAWEGGHVAGEDQEEGKLEEGAEG